MHIWTSSFHYLSMYTYFPQQLLNKIFGMLEPFIAINEGIFLEMGIKTKVNQGN